MRTAGLQHRPAHRHLHTAVRVMQPNLLYCLLAPLPLAQQPGQAQRQCQQHQPAPAQPPLHRLHAVRHQCGRRLHHGLRCVDLSAYRQQPQQRQNRQQHGSGQQHRLVALPGHTCTPCKVQAHAAVQPCHGQQAQLQRSAPRVPQRCHYALIAVGHIPHGGGPAGGSKVCRHQQRQSQAAGQAHRFRHRHAPGAPLRHCQPRQTGMRQQSPVQKDGAQHRMPQPMHGRTHGLCTGQRHQPHGVVQQMQRHIHQQHPAAAPAQAAHRGPLPTAGVQQRQPCGQERRKVHEGNNRHPARSDSAQPAVGVG